jgi:ligand-binding sensor domain-containing protein
MQRRTAAGHKRARGPLFAAGLLLLLQLAAIVAPPPVRAAADTWSTYMDGTFGQGIAADRGPGQVWVASTGGATAFAPADSTYRRLYPNDGLPAADLTAVAVDASGHRWFGTRGAGLQVQAADGRFLSRPLDRFDLGSDSMRVLLAVGDSAWVGTATGAALVTYPTDPSRPGDAVLATINLEAILGASPHVNGIAARGDTTWFGTERGVVRRDPDGSRAVVNAGLADLDVRALMVSGGYLWAGTRTSVYRLTDGTWIEHAQGLVVGRPYVCFAEHAGELHVGAPVRAQNPTVYRLVGATWSPRAAGLTTRDVNGLVSLAGELWAATNRGLHRLGANETWRRTPSPDLPGPGLYAFSNDYVDVATLPGTGRARAVTRSVLTELVAESGAGPDFAAVQRGNQGIENQDFAALLVSRAGTTWLGHCCCGTGSSCRGEELAALSDTAAQLATWDVIDMTEGPDGAIWFASVRHEASEGFGVYRIDPATRAVAAFTAADGLTANSVEALAFDSGGRLWIGYTDDGADMWSNPGRLPAVIAHVETAEGLPATRVTALAARDNEMWIGTVSGIAVFAGTELVRTIAGSALPDPLVNALATDGCGRLWVGTPAGAAALDRDGQTLSVVNAQTRPGLAADQVNAIAADRGGAAVWFATAGGLSRLAYDAACAGGGGEGDGGAACSRLCPYPNPLRPGAGDGLRLTAADGVGEVRITVLDAAGNEVASRIAQATDQVWDGRDDGGDPVPSGVYLLRILSTRATCNCAPDFRRVAVQQ